MEQVLSEGKDNFSGVDPGTALLCTQSDDSSLLSSEPVHGSMSRRPSCVSEPFSLDMSGSEDSGESAFSGSVTWQSPTAAECDGEGNVQVLDLSLRIHDSSGRTQILKFQFDLSKDSCASVAREMVLDLQLPDESVPRIARKIHDSIAKERAKRQAQSAGVALGLGGRAAEFGSAHPGCAVRKADLVAVQHQKLVEKHLQRVGGLMTETRGMPHPVRREGHPPSMTSWRSFSDWDTGKVKLCRFGTCCGGCRELVMEQMDILRHNGCNPI
uniref:Uncharacterized protein n=1 Tax=Tetraselmis sp. GSL018 TaxID=582737 RepID=A0A061QSI2_9CHLO